MERLKLRLDQAVQVMRLQASKANLFGSYVPNYAAVLTPQINAVTDEFAKLFKADEQAPPRAIDISTGKAYPLPD
jgi:hypothetical protein